MSKLFNFFYTIITVAARVLVLAFGATTFIQILAWLGWDFFKRWDATISQHTTTLVPFLPLEDGVGLFSSWSTLGKYTLAILPYFVILMLFRILIVVGKEKGVSSYDIKMIVPTVTDYIPWFASLVISVQLLLSLIKVLNPDSLGAVIKYLNLFAMGTLIASETINKKDLLEGAVSSDPDQITSEDIEEKEAFEKKLLRAEALKYLNKKQFSKCEKHCRVYLGKYGQNKEIVMLLAMSLAQLKRFEEGFQIAQNAIEKYPDDKKVKELFTLFNKQLPKETP